MSLIKMHKHGCYLKSKNTRISYLHDSNQAIIFLFYCFVYLNLKKINKI